MIEKKIYYVWIGNAKKPDIFYKCLESWKKNLPDFEIIEINEKNFNMETHLAKNKFFRECYERKLWAYVSDYMRVHFMYENSGIYVDTDMEIIKDFYENDIWKQPIWTIPKIFTYTFEKKYNLSEKRENTLKNGEIVIFPKEYFYPYGFHEKYIDDCIKPETYGIHWWNDSWSSLKARLFLETKHLSGVKKMIKKMRIIARFYLKEKR